MPTAIGREEVESLVRAGAQLVDVLPREEYADEHLPGAINLPVADIPQRAPELLPDRRARIVTYCGGPT